MPSPESTDTWDARTYRQYADERSRPFLDLLARVDATEPAEAPSHTLLRELADSPQWTDKMEGALRGANSVFDAMGYFRILTEAGLTVDAWETTYLHVLSGQDPVLRWTSGTALRPVLAVLGDADAQAFTSQYAGLLRVAYPADSAGRVILPFRRVFAVARREERV